MGYLTPADVPISDNWQDHRDRGSAEPGTDYEIAYGTDLRAPADGVVIGVDRDPGGAAGRRLTMLLDDGRMVDWIHLSTIEAWVGMRFSRGQYGLAHSGASRYGEDWGVGPHVHVTLRADRWRPFSDTLNFEDYVDGGGNPGGSGGQFPAFDLYGEEWVKAAQTKLAALGLYSGAIDGRDGEQTQGGTRVLQQAGGLNDDGVFGPDTNGRADTILAGGNASWRATSDVQQALANAGFDPGAIDNDWGGKTSFALYRYQRAHGLEADAVYGPASDASLFPTAPAQPAPAAPVGKNYTDRPTSQIQQFLNDHGYVTKIDSDYGADTTRSVIAWQRDNNLDPDGDWGNASDGIAFPPEGSIYGVDYSFARPDIQVLVSRGVKHAGRYLFYADDKGIRRPEYDALVGAEISPWFIYEEDGHELSGGFAAGVRVATEAEKQLNALGLSGYPIYFNVDYDAQANDFNAISDALKGIASVIGLNRTGLYAGFNVIRMMFDAGLITWGFQTAAWSGGQWDPRAQLQQWANGQWGDAVDFTRATVPDFGQAPVPLQTAPEQPIPDPTPEVPAPTPIPEEKPMPKPPVTDQQITAITQTASLAGLDKPDQPVIPDQVAKPLWIGIAAATVTVPSAAAFASLLGWVDPGIATQASTIVVGWPGSIAAVLGLSRYGKTKS